MINDINVVIGQEPLLTLITVKDGIRRAELGFSLITNVNDINDAPSGLALPLTTLMIKDGITTRRVIPPLT